LEHGFERGYWFNRWKQYGIKLKDKVSIVKEKEKYYSPIFHEDDNSDQPLTGWIYK